MTKRRNAGRPSGSVEQDHESRKAQILERLSAEVFRSKRLPALKGLAKIAGVSVSTLVHYFKDRDALCSELLKYFGAAGEQFHLPKARVPTGPFPKSIADLCQHIADGLRGPLHAIHEFGFFEGLRSPAIRESYLNQILDRTLDAVAARLREHARRGDYHTADPRADAMLIVGPLFLASFHQNALGGGKNHALDIGEVAELTARNFCSKKMHP